jgi:putative hemolysin
LLIILLLVLANGILAGAEIAVVAARKTRIQQLAREGSGAARAVKRLHEDPERFFATVQIGITVIAATAGAFGGATFARDLEPILRRVSVLAPYAEELSLVVVVSVVSFLSLIFGELVPKSLALRSSERYALLIGRPLLALSSVARPFVWLLTACSNAVLRLFGDRTTFSETRLAPEELQQLMGEAADKGDVDPTAGKIASRALDFAKLTAEQIMVPRARIVAIPLHATSEEVRRILIEQGRTRMPIYEDTIDNIIGYATLRDLAARLMRQSTTVLEDAMRPAFRVPEPMRAVDLLDEMQRRRTELAIVIDEYGATSGIVTFEDLAEELVGDIFSEHDSKGEESIRPEPDGTTLVRGDVPVRDVNRALGLDLPQSEHWSSIAGLCLDLAGRIPVEGDTLTTPDGTTLEITGASLRQIRTVRIRPPDRPPSDDD